MLKIYKDYDIIHFHTSIQMYKARKFLETYEGQVLFTTHSPMLLSKEMKEDASILSQKIFTYFFKKLPIVDKYAFEHANYIIFPCEEAEEPYFGEKVYEKAKKDKIFKYISTGVVDCKEKVKIDYITFRQQKNIPNDAFVFSYVGRHNEVKGYNDLKKAAKIILNKYSNVYFLIAGEESPIKGLDHPRWIETGYTKDPYSLINASDVFILPNKQTYFDLVFLEVISIGKKMIVSDTGGNKYFKKYNSKDILYFNTIEKLTEQMKKVIDNSSKKSNTRNIFLNEFTCEMFAKRYVKLLNCLSD